MDAWVIEGGVLGGAFDAFICKRARVKLKDSYWYSVFNLLYFFSPPFRSQEVVSGVSLRAGSSGATAASHLHASGWK